MKTKAVRLYGKDDLYLEEFDLPALKEDEILAQVISDSICNSSYKAAKQGADHKRVPDDVESNPTIIGHEFSGEILEVGNKWQDRFKEGSKFSIQPALNYKGSLDAPGYSFRYIGGDANFNFYNVHYAGTHVEGTSGGNNDDKVAALELMSQGLINPAVMITHLGGLNAVVDTTLSLPHIPGGQEVSPGPCINQTGIWPTAYQIRSGFL